MPWLSLAVVAPALILAPPAAATTFCVPAFHAACPAGGANVQQADLETAMQSNANDGVADLIVIAAGTHTNAGSIDPNGADPLEIAGAGRGATLVTSSSTGNIFVVNLDSRDVTMHDLTIVVPASLPDGLGSALQAEGDTIEDVDLESRNPGSGGPSFVGGGTFRGGRVYGAAGGSFDEGIDNNPNFSGTLIVEDASIEGALIGIRVPSPLVAVVVRRSRVVDVATVGVEVTGGGFAIVENTLIRTGAGRALRASTSTSDTTTLSARNVTLVQTGVGDPAVEAIVTNAVGNGSANVTVRDSILHGFASSYGRVAPVSPTVGQANLTIRDSNFSPNGISSGDGTLSVSTGNIDADPLFAGPADYRLLAGSPSIDAADAAAGGPTHDLTGAPRPVDGDGNGTARSDQGAFEYQLPAPPGPSQPDPGQPDPGQPGPGGQLPAPPTGSGGDGIAPLVSRLRAGRLSARRGGSLELSLSEAARLELTFAPVGSRASARRRTVRLRYSARRGRNVLRIKRRQLSAGRWRLTLVAVDPAGNRSRPARRTLTVRR